MYCLTAARLYPFCLSLDGLHSTPMSTSVKFSDAPSVLGFTYSARWGRYGITVMHYLRTNQNAQLRVEPSGANYSLDYSANVTPPPAPQCRNYHDLLDTLQGLSSFGSADWYEPTTHPLKSLRLFVGANMDTDPGHTPHRVQRTLVQVNHLLGSTFFQLASVSPVQWREFKANARRIDFEPASWSLDLQATVGLSIPTALVAPSSAAQRVVIHPTSVMTRPTAYRMSPRAHPVCRGTRAMPSMCYGGSKTKFTSNKRTHTWPDPLPQH
ncbi:hypothetical protein PHMEG_00010531 [Phytophthora megakarya]|uniref:Uncharacterized protein n=1 Tax=Phytophthora megakarya TaxID=4795 RepID=A0A225WFY8_9STRA|nr:hypothetical protein PHMEG_00010531 [Phytophthora megakarya]